MFFIYRLLTTILFPFLIILIYLRKLLKKEDSKRFIEKIYIDKEENKFFSNNNLLWFHVASIGELTSIMPVINFLLNDNNKIKIIISSVTLSSGRLFEANYKNYKNLIHIYFPIDTPHLARGFLDKWKPKFIGFVDSEIWPNFIHEINKRKIPLVLINGRITDKTLNRWKILKNFSENIFSKFNLCLACSKDSEENLRKLKASNIKFIGNLKFIDQINKKNNLENKNIVIFSKKKVWCAASTHKGEEEFCVKTHIKIKKDIKDILTIIIPRHIARNNEILKMCQIHKLKVQVLNERDIVKDDSEILLINSFGSLNQVYKFCQSVFMGKSLLKKLELVGGQNPLEAAKLGCKVYHGKYTYNFKEIYEFLKSNNISQEIDSVDQLSNFIVQDFQKNELINKDDIQLINEFGNKIFKNTINELNKFIK